MFTRTIEKQIRNNLFNGKVIILYGPRQAGKTTLAQKILDDYQDTRYLSCDDPQVREQLDNATTQSLQELFKERKLVVIDEAQRVENIGVTLKILYENLPDLQVIATGSSSFELANGISEPLTGRKKVFYLYPISREELQKQYDQIQRKSLLQNRLIYGMYPEIIQSGKEEELISLVDSYLYKDILAYQKIKKSDLIVKLLQAIAFQVGSQVSYRELGETVGIHHKTVENYITLLEQSFVIFRLGTLSRNLRNELKKTRKIYFRDLGVRNALINNFNAPNLRDDMGHIRENFFIAERMKFLHNWAIRKNTYFRRTHQQQEIDYIEEASGKLDAFDIKRNPKKKGKMPKNFIETYAPTQHHINPETFQDYLVKKT